MKNKRESEVLNQTVIEGMCSINILRRSSSVMQNPAWVSQFFDILSASLWHWDKWEKWSCFWSCCRNINHSLYFTTCPALRKLKQTIRKCLQIQFDPGLFWQVKEQHWPTSQKIDFFMHLCSPCVVSSSETVLKYYLCNDYWKCTYGNIIKQQYVFV